jgi:hypothetical protein
MRRQQGKGNVREKGESQEGNGRISVEEELKCVRELPLIMGSTSKSGPLKWRTSECKHGSRARSQCGRPVQREARKPQAAGPQLRPFHRVESWRKAAPSLHCALSNLCPTYYSALIAERGLCGCSPPHGFRHRAWG